MKKHLFLIACFCSFLFVLQAQNPVDQTLTSILQNNKTLQAQTQYWEAQALQYKTGLTLANPTVNYDYLVGNPASAGNQTDFSITQSFDFPSAYAKRHVLSQEKIAQIEFQLAVTRQEVLLEAKKACLELVYRHKVKNELERRKFAIEQLLDKFQTQLKQGAGSRLEVNKAQLQLIEITKKVQRNDSEIEQKNQLLTALNGGNVLNFKDSSYTLTVIPLSFEEMEAAIEKIDPVRKLLEQQQLIAEHQADLSRILSLPKFELGYHYQGILGQRYQGAHIGFTIPLWENKNVTKAALSAARFSDLKLQEHKNEHYFEIKQLFEKFTNLKLSLQQYEEVFTTFNHTALLEKALRLGELSSIEYFLEISYYYSAFDSFLETEFEAQLVLAELTKNEL